MNMLWKAKFEIIQRLNQNFTKYLEVWGSHYSKLYMDYKCISMWLWHGDRTEQVLFNIVKVRGRKDEELRKIAVPVSIWLYMQIMHHKRMPYSMCSYQRLKLADALNRLIKSFSFHHDFLGCTDCSRLISVDNVRITWAILFIFQFFTSL